MFYRCFVYSQKLTGLAPNTLYYYQVGVPDNGTSEVMSFSSKEGNLVFAVSFQPIKLLSKTHVHWCSFLPSEPPGLGNMSRDLSDLQVHALLTDTLVSGKQLYLRPSSQNPVFLDSDTSSVFSHSRKRPATVMGTIFATRGCPLTRASTWYMLYINNPQTFMSITWMSYYANFVWTNRKFKVQGVFIMMLVGEYTVRSTDQEMRSLFSSELIEDRTCEKR